MFTKTSATLILLTSLVFSQAPTGKITIKGSEETPVYKLVRLSPENVPADAGITWDIYPDENVDYEILQDNSIVFTGPPGKYSVSMTAIIIDGKKLKTTRAKGTFYIGPKIPPQPMPPGPTPPNPPNPPVPKTDSLYIAIVNDSSMPSPNMARVLGDTPFWNSLRPNHEWDIWDILSPIASDRGYTQIAKSLQTGGQFKPVLILADKKTGKPIKSILLPGTTAEVKTLIDSLVSASYNPVQEVPPTLLPATVAPVMGFTGIFNGRRYMNGVCIDCP